MPYLKTLEFVADVSKWGGFTFKKSGFLASFKKLGGLATRFTHPHQLVEAELQCLPVPQCGPCGLPRLSPRPAVFLVRQQGAHAHYRRACAFT